MDLQLHGAIVIVTGGGSGIGGGISKALAREGAIPAIFGRSPLKEDFRQAIHGLQPETHFEQFNFSDEKNCAAAVSRVAERFGRIDGLVNCAGANDGVGLEAGTEAFRKSLENNLMHYYTMCLSP